jgi:feruloyl esterase
MSLFVNPYRTTALVIGSLVAATGAWAHSVDCAAFAATALPGVTLQTESVAADTTRPPGVSAGPLLTAHCKVTGKMAERLGQGGKPYYVGFELRLPTAWNGRFLYQGGGGNDGVLRPAVGPQAAPGYALNRGFAVVTTDAGHQGPSADFGFDPIARIDHAYNAHDKVAVTAKALIRHYYNKPADKSYFVGCSGGGRQAMMFTQRFPDYFDGVIAMAPAMRVSKGATIAAAWDTQALQAIAPLGGDGLPVLSQALSDGDLNLVREAILNRCDALDGVSDHLVSNPAACQFDVADLQCKGAKNDHCLAPQQVGALKKIFSGATNSTGQPLYFSWPWDAGIGHPQNDWRMWKLGNSPTSKANSRHVFLMEDALQGNFVTPPDRSLSIYRFDFDRDPPRMDANAWIYNTDSDVKLSGFQARGGKLMFIHGLADPIFSANETVDYYQRLTAQNGSRTNEFARLFLVPGMGHCAGGAATDSFDGLGSLVNWVETGQAPQSIPARGTAVFPGRSRPLCAYPQYARYNGTGNPEDASSFSCH